MNQSDGRKPIKIEIGICEDGSDRQVHVAVAVGEEKGTFHPSPEEVRDMAHKLLRAAEAVDGKPPLVAALEFSGGMLVLEAEVKLAEPAATAKPVS